LSVTAYFSDGVKMCDHKKSPARQGSFSLRKEDHLR
jgi:hypothetical protein